MIAIWAAALFGLGCALIPAPVIDRLVSASGIPDLLPALAPPIGQEARIVLCLAAALIGARIGLGLARLYANARRRANPARSHRMAKITGVGLPPEPEEEPAEEFDLSRYAAAAPMPDPQSHFGKTHTFEAPPSMHSAWGDLPPGPSAFGAQDSLPEAQNDTQSDFEPEIWSSTEAPAEDHPAGEEPIGPPTGHAGESDLWSQEWRPVPEPGFDWNLETPGGDIWSTPGGKDMGSLSDWEQESPPEEPADETAPEIAPEATPEIGLEPQIDPEISGGEDDAPLSYSQEEPADPAQDAVPPLPLTLEQAAPPPPKPVLQETETPEPPPSLTHRRAQNVDPVDPGLLSRLTALRTNPGEDEEDEAEAGQSAAPRFAWSEPRPEARNEPAPEEPAEAEPEAPAEAEPESVAEESAEQETDAGPIAESEAAPSFEIGEPGEMDEPDVTAEPAAGFPAEPAMEEPAEFSQDVLPEDDEYPEGEEDEDDDWHIPEAWAQPVVREPSAPEPAAPEETPEQGQDLAPAAEPPASEFSRADDGSIGPDMGARPESFASLSRDIPAEDIGDDEEWDEEAEFAEEDEIGEGPILDPTLGAFRDYARDYTGGDDGEEEEDEEEEEDSGDVSFGSLLGMKVRRHPPDEPMELVGFDGEHVTVADSEMHIQQVPEEDSDGASPLVVRRRAGGAG